MREEEGQRPDHLDIHISNTGPACISTDSPVNLFTGKSRMWAATHQVSEQFIFHFCHSRPSDKSRMSLTLMVTRTLHIQMLTRYLRVQLPVFDILTKAHWNTIEIKMFKVYLHKVLSSDQWLLASHGSLLVIQEDLQSWQKHLHKERMYLLSWFRVYQSVTAQNSMVPEACDATRGSRPNL